MKIIHILSTPQFSGAENVACQIISMFRDSNYEMVYCSPDGPIANALKERGIRFHPMKKISAGDIRKLISDESPDIIHAHDMGATYHASKVCGDIPIVSHIHNNWIASRYPSLKSIGYLWSSRKVSHILWVSESALKGYFFRPFVASKSSVLVNILDLDVLNERSNDEDASAHYDLLYIGRLEEQKNPIRLVEIIKKIKNQYPNLRAAIIGEGTLKHDVELRISKYNLGNNVDLLGYLDNPLPLLKNAKALLLSSKWEGTPMCALEAMGLSVPVVSTPVDGLKCLIRNDYNGFLSESDDLLAAAALKIITNYSYQKKLSSGALKSSLELNDKQKYKEELISVYNNIVDSKSKRFIKY